MVLTLYISTTPPIEYIGGAIVNVISLGLLNLLKLEVVFHEGKGLFVLFY